MPRALSTTFQKFFDSEKSGGVLLIACTIVSMGVANSSFGSAYVAMWHVPLGGLTLETWINDALMAIFFLLIGLELERELYVGELSSLNKALLPMFAAIGGMIAPAMFHLSINAGSPTQSGLGIPMATDIAFALGILALIGQRVPPALKVFVVAFAVIDDLGAIVIIAIFYTAKVSLPYLAASILIWFLLIALGRIWRVMSLLPYLVGGVVMWACMLKSGVHATVAGVMLAFAIPFSAKDDDEKSPSYRLEHWLHKPVAFVVLPIFALANTGIIVGADWSQSLMSTNSLGIIGGLLLGKPVGVGLFCSIAVLTGVCSLPVGMNKLHMLGAGLLGGIGFTMSIFITNLAFPGDGQIINASKMAILLASLIAGSMGFVWLRFFCGQDVEK
jgi:NhaA family Na+:H+ antiporter